MPPNHTPLNNQGTQASKWANRLKWTIQIVVFLIALGFAVYNLYEVFKPAPTPLTDPDEDRNVAKITSSEMDEDMNAIFDVLRFVGSDIIAKESAAVKPLEYALAKRDGNRRVIHYNKETLELANDLLLEPDERWCSKWIFAHEMGHHLLDHVGNNRFTRRAEELQADRFAGFVMRLLDADSSESIFVIENIIFDSDLDYPPTYERIEYTLLGWNEANDYINQLTNNQLQLPQ